jgi:spermidine/putrescine ABC transporter ATP-binding subunit
VTAVHPGAGTAGRQAPPDTTPRAASGALVLSSLTKRYGDRTALAGLDLSIGRGEFFTILGPSGSGKTTTLMLIAGFVDPDEGAITLEDAPLVGVPPAKRNIGVVFQSYALFPHLDVFENVAFPLRARGLRDEELRRRVGEALDLVGLPGYERSFPSQLSGGQQQRVALARAVVFEPVMLLMDEPLGALDRRLRMQLQVELRRLQRRLGITVVYVTHDQEEALSMSDRIAILSDGHLQQVASPPDIYDRPRNRFVAEFMGDSNILAGECGGRSGGGYELRTGEGVTVVHCEEAEPVVGDPLSVMIRPEALMLAPHDGAAVDGPGWAGVVDEALYLGDQTKSWVTLASGVRLLVKSSGSRTRPPLPPGTPVRVDYHPADVRVLAEP